MVRNNEHCGGILLRETRDIGILVVALLYREKACEGGSGSKCNCCGVAAPRAGPRTTVWAVLKGCRAHTITVSRPCRRHRRIMTNFHVFYAMSVWCGVRHSLWVSERFARHLILYVFDFTHCPSAALRCKSTKPRVPHSLSLSANEYVEHPLRGFQETDGVRWTVLTAARNEDMTTTSIDVETSRQRNSISGPHHLA